MKGLTGTIKFNDFGQRTDFVLDVLELKKNGFLNVRLRRAHILQSSCLRACCRIVIYIY